MILLDKLIQGSTTLNAEKYMHAFIPYQGTKKTKQTNTDEELD